MANQLHIYINNPTAGGMDGTEASQDLLGRTYEYCISQFAAVEGKGGGEFYTPSCVVRTLVEVLRPFNNCRVYDATVTVLIQAHSSCSRLQAA